MADSQTFYGTCTGSDTVILMLYGPGAYTNGIVVAMPSVGVDNSWSYTWNPGYSLMSGTYVMIAYDKQEIASDKAIFSVVGGGRVSITTSNYVIGQGDTVTYSGLCTNWCEKCHPDTLRARTIFQWCGSRDPDPQCG